jgi:hypothetical protein
VQGPSSGRTRRIRTSLVFGVAFFSGATTLFLLVYLLGRVLGVADLPVGWRAGLGAAGLLGLAAIDVAAARKSTYCPLGWRRQTPRSLMRRRSVTFVAAAWGFDTGLAVTTVRVAALTWGAILLVGLGLSAWFTGIGYGLGFAVPFLVLLWTHRAGRLAKTSGPVDPGLESLLARRKAVQALSAALLAAAGSVLVGVNVLW